MPRYISSQSYRGCQLSDAFKSRIRAEDEWLPRHYIVSVPTATSRRTAMIRKTSRLGLDYKLVDAYVPTNPEIVNHYGRCRNLKTGKWGYSSPMGGVVACMASHFKALKEFIESGDELGVIIEDDILFRIDYKERLGEIIHKYIDTATFPNLVTFIGFNFPDDELTGNGKINDAWCTFGYLITRTYAQHVIATYDRPHYQLDIIIKTDRIPTSLDKFGASSELIVMKSGGLVCNFPLVIEDRTNHTSIIGNKAIELKQYGYHNFIPDVPD